MVMGLKIVSREELNNEKASILSKISVETARPLHWQLRSNECAQPPTLLYIIQALLILLVLTCIIPPESFMKEPIPIILLRII